MSQEIKVFSNEWITQGLQRREMIEPLEHLLSEEIERYKALKKLKDEGKLDFGEVLSHNKIEEALKQVKPKVDAFLGVDDFEGLPEVGSVENKTESERNSIKTIIGLITATSVTATITVYSLLSQDYTIRDKVLISLASNIPEMIMLGLAGYLLHLCNSTDDSYSHLFKKIFFRYEERAAKIPIVAHEYAHFVYHSKTRESYHASEYDGSDLGYNKQKKASNEGLAFAAERHISQHYSEQEDNPAFLYDVAKRVVSSLKTVYKLCCKVNKQSPKKSVINVSSYLTYLDDQHTLGFVSCMLEELAQGNGIYKQMLQGTFQPMVVIPN